MPFFEPDVKRAETFFDLQNLYLSAKSAWGIKYPNFDPVALSRLVVSRFPLWKLTGIHLYTGIHSSKKNVFWHSFWTNKLASHKAKDTRVDVFTTPLHYNNGVPSEKGVDIRIALDLVRAARLNRCDVVILFSRDTDFAEVAKEIRAIAYEKQRWIKIASVMPDHPSMKRGIDGTDWIRLSLSDYSLCIDHNDYRHRRAAKL